MIDPKYRKPASFRTSDEIQHYVEERDFYLHFDEDFSVYRTPVTLYGRTVGNRFAILPMEGWDCEADGTPSDLTHRRWLRFAASGAKLLAGTEAGAVMHEGRSNPRQLLVAPHTQNALKETVAEMRQVHREKFGSGDDLMIGLQLTHSGRYAHPNEAAKLEARTAYANPLLDEKFHCTEANVVRDDEIPAIIENFVTAARVAYEAGFDFVDVKLAHGYLAHEFLSAVTRRGPYGGSFENRTRFYREIVEKIHAAVPHLAIASRFSIFDEMPFVKGADGIGHPMAWNEARYPFAFGGDGTGLGMDPDLTEPVQMVQMMQQYGVELVVATVGSPYYCVHLQRTAYFAVSDGYDMPEDPLYNVGRHTLAAARLKALCPGIKVVGSGYTCLQEFLAPAGAAALKRNETDFVGLGRMVLSYPDYAADVLADRPVDRCRLCRTFGECTNAPRHGMVSGCYPLDEFYQSRTEAGVLKTLKAKR